MVSEVGGSNTFLMIFSIQSDLNAERSTLSVAVKNCGFSSKLLCCVLPLSLFVAKLDILRK